MERRPKYIDHWLLCAWFFSCLFAEECLLWKLSLSWYYTMRVCIGMHFVGSHIIVAASENGYRPQDCGLWPDAKMKWEFVEFWEECLSFALGKLGIFATRRNTGGLVSTITSVCSWLLVFMSFPHKSDLGSTTLVDGTKANNYKWKLQHCLYMESYPHIALRTWGYTMKTPKLISWIMRDM